MTTRKMAQADLMHTLDALQEEIRSGWLRQSLPDEWNGLDTFHGIDRHKTRVTIRLDADMVRWFRKLGPNYSRRMNEVLRVYWTALLAGHVKGYFEDDTTPRLMAEVRRIRDKWDAEAAAAEAGANR